MNAPIDYCEMWKARPGEIPENWHAFTIGGRMTIATVANRLATWRRSVPASQSDVALEDYRR